MCYNNNKKFIHITRNDKVKIVDMRERIYLIYKRAQNSHIILKALKPVHLRQSMHLDFGANHGRSLRSSDNSYTCSFVFTDRLWLTGQYSQECVSIGIC